MPLEKKVAVQDLTTGMYVSRLDRPWVETPFLFQGFMLSTATDIDELSRHCDYVYIDADRGLDAKQALQEAQQEVDRQVAELVARPVGHQVYPTKTSLEEERAVAKQSYDRLKDSFSTVMDDAESGKPLNLTDTKSAVDDVVSSIIRNPDAFVWLTRLKDKDNYAYTHAIDNCALAANFARHLGLPLTDIRNLALATLLLDIGKIKLPSEMLAKPGKLTEPEFRLMRKHVQFSLELLTGTRGITKDILTTIATHHERHNGQGYPRKLEGGNIPVYGRIAAIVDCYDAITSDRPYAKAMSQHQAIRALYEWRDQDFQASMIEQFIQCLGIYPTGSLVEMTTGEVGIVLAQNAVRRLKPIVMLVLDKDKIAYEFHPKIDLIKQELNESGEPYDIARPLEPGSFGIDPADFYV